MRRPKLPFEPVVHEESSSLKILDRGFVPVPMRWQRFHDSWRGTSRDVRWYGRCAVCHRNVWACDDGENDPRGVLGDNALWPCEFEFDRYRSTVRTCSVCANDYDSYLRAEAMAKARMPGIQIYPLIWPAPVTDY